jgi:hypothetical protein
MTTLVGISTEPDRFNSPESEVHHICWVFEGIELSVEKQILRFAQDDNSARNQ